jgi:hypothetical protein
MVFNNYSEIYAYRKKNSKLKKKVRDHPWDKEKNGLILQGDYCIWIIDN